MFALALFGAVVSLAAEAPRPEVPAYLMEDEGHGLDLIIRRYISPDIRSPLVLSANDRHIIVVGRMHCTQGERFRIDVTLQQAATGAYAEGHTQATCSGEIQLWEVDAVARGPVPFKSGPASASAVATTWARGRLTDTFHWSRNLTLVH